jgi:hypothetical protein
MIVPLAVRPVRLGIVFGDKALMGKLRPLPTHYLLEMHLSHAPHHVEMGFDEIFPALTGMDIFFLDVESFTNGEQLLGPKHSAVIGDELFRRAKPFDCGIQDNQHTREILALKNIAGENGT